MADSAFITTMDITTIELQGVDDIVNVTAAAHAFGSTTGTGRNPSIGELTWNGVMLGADISSTARRGRAIRGDASISVDGFVNPRVNVTFDNIVDEAGMSRNALQWRQLPVTQGAFSSLTSFGTTRSIGGIFYGPSQDEVAGTFVVEEEMIGSYGAIRD